MCRIGIGERILDGLFHYEMVSKKNGRITFNSYKKKRAKSMTIRFGALKGGVFMLQWKMSLLP